ncbi:MAG: formyltetrahydrofolate deformylase [Candidatus Zapsychrus exili]|nr:formyltetrahydrofolate deformylase [Candidatus Zapsychrus exili]
MTDAVLLVSCPDNKGITAAVTDFVYKNYGNILHADQHTDQQTDTFFMRIEWSLEGFALERVDIENAFKSIVEKFKMDFELHFTDETPNVAIFASKQLHCLYDLLLRYKAGQFNCNIPLIVSNHIDAKVVADEFGIKFSEVPITKENKEEQEQKELQILKNENIDLIVLARYHQIFTKSLVDEYKKKIINIHHSFLPAFVGKNPYDQAYQKGVKLIGATSHYVTEELDQGPIIEQSTARVSHRDSLEDLVRIGEDLEKMVLSRAVRWHLQRKILSYNNKTVVFD